MSDAREIIAEVIQDFRDAGQPINDVVLSVSDDIISTLTAAGYRILGPDEVDQVTVEKCAAIARECFDDPQAEADPNYIAAAIHSIGRKA